jgi:hypothetical protein
MAGLGGEDGVLLVGADGEAVVEDLLGEAFVGGDLVLLEAGEQALGREPALERVAEVVRPAEIAEPDAAVGGELAEPGAAVGGEDEGQAELADIAPIPVVELDVAGGLEAAAVALGLLEGRGDLEVLAFRFDRAEREQADEEDVVGRALCGGPFGDGHVLALLGAGSLREAQVLGIDGPAGLAELLVDQAAGRGFVEVDVGCRGGGGLDERRDRLGRGW